MLLAAATVRSVVGSSRLRGRTTRRRRRRQRLRPYVASTWNAAPAPAPVCGCRTAAALAAFAGSVCRGRTCCGARLASTCWSARSARARGACRRQGGCGAARVVQDRCLNFQRARYLTPGCGARELCVGRFALVLNLAAGFGSAAQAADRCPSGARAVGGREVG